VEETGEHQVHSETCARRETGELINDLRGTVHGHAIQAARINDIQFNFGPPAPMQAPRQLLPPPAHFTGRTAELKRLREFVDGRRSGSTTVIAVTGLGGVGKTSLALAFLHQLRSRYTAGQLYADLGAVQQGEPAGPADVLGRFLRALGVPPEGVPADLQERAALFRSLTHERPIAILLDNAFSAAQARALLPGPGPNLVVVTSRRRIAGLALDGAQFTDLTPLSEQAAVELLERIMGDDRTASEPEAARRLVAMCDRLPLAVCASAARLTPRPRWSIGRMVEELANERRRLAALSVEEDVSVRAVFDMSYQSLPGEAALLYRRVGLLPVADFGVGVASAASGTEIPKAADLLEILTETNLLEEVGHNRFRYHDLLRLHARARLEEDPVEERQAITARTVDWYTRAVTAADLRIMPKRWHLSPQYELLPEPPAEMKTPAAAVEWLETELDNILAVLRWAAENRMYDAGWQICEALWGLFTFHKHYDAWLESHLVGLRCAQELADPRAEARMRVQLGGAYRSLRQYDQALDHFRQALTLEREAGHRLGEGTALDQLGVVLLRLGRFEQAIEQFTRSRTIHDEIGIPRGVALMNLNIGQALGELGRLPEALTHLELAERQFDSVDEPYHRARTLTSVAGIKIRLDRPMEAIGPLEQALTVLTELSASYDQAGVLVRLAELAERLGRHDEARGHLERALDLFTSVGAAQAEQVRARLFPDSSPPTRT